MSNRTVEMTGAGYGGDLRILLGAVCCCLFLSSQAHAEPKPLVELKTVDTESSKKLPFDFLAISDDGWHLASSGIRGGLCLWDIAASKPPQILESSEPSDSDLFFDPTARTAIEFVPDSKRFAVLKVACLPDKVVVDEFGLKMKSYSFSPRLQLWDLAAGKIVHDVEVPKPPIYSLGQHFWTNPRLSISRDGKSIAADFDTIESPKTGDIPAAWLERLKIPEIYKKATTLVGVWDLGTMRQTKKLSAAWGFAPMTLSPDGTRLAAWDGAASAINIYSLRSAVEPAKPELVLRAPSYGFIFAMTLDEGNTTLAVTHNNMRKVAATGELGETDEMQIDQWDIRSGTVRRTSQMLRYLHDVQPVASGNGAVLAAATDGQTITIFDVATATARTTLHLAKQSFVKGICLSRNGRFAAASTEGGSILAWDLQPVAR